MPQERKRSRLLHWGEETASFGALASLGDRGADAAGRAAGGLAEGGGLDDRFLLADGAEEVVLSGLDGVIRGPKEGDELGGRMKIHGGPCSFPPVGGNLTSGNVVSCTGVYGKDTLRLYYGKTF